jgi:hypothetical protein
MRWLSELVSFPERPEKTIFHFPFLSFHCSLAETVGREARSSEFSELPPCGDDK